MTSRRRWWVLTLHDLLGFVRLMTLITWPVGDLPEHIESMFNDCEYASDTSLVLHRASKNEPNWLARFARKHAEQERGSS
jgi:hypothetical protein